MQLQLALGIADRLHQHLLVRGEPFEVPEATHVLLGVAAKGALPQHVLDTLVRHDRRFCWTDSARNLLGLRSWQDCDPDLSDVPFVALDLETTGAKAGLGKITEVGAVRIEGLKVISEFHTLVNPQRPIPPMITHLTGISESMVADAPRIEEILPSLMALLEGAVVVAHNAPFDVGFLNYELHRVRGVRLGEGAVDTLPLSRALVPGLVNYRLGTVAKSLGSPVAACHRALADAQAVAHVFVHLAQMLQSRDICTLNGLRQCGRSSVPSALQKLPLTRYLPEDPGVYTFVDGEDRVLLVGSADRLAPAARSVITQEHRGQKGLRTAVRLVERIEHEKAATPLEALVREHSLLLEHRPPYNRWRCAPESYLYIRAGGGRSGLSLSTTRRAPRWLQNPGGEPGSRDGLIIGPFRRRSSAHAAVELLQDCYPVRRCDCDAGVRAANDALVTDLVCWLAGHTPSTAITDPLQVAAAAADKCRRAGSREEAEAITQGCDHLNAVRHAYRGLAEARRLCFACIWPQNGGDRRALRLNVVVRGVMRTAVSMDAEHLDSQLMMAFDVLTPVKRSVGSSEGRPRLVAVRQEELDCLLSVRRWFRDLDGSRDPHAAVVSWQDSEPDSYAAARTRIESLSRLLLEREA